MSICPAKWITSKPFGITNGIRFDRWGSTKIISTRRLARSFPRWMICTWEWLRHRHHRSGHVFSHSPREWNICACSSINPNDCQSVTVSLDTSGTVTTKFNVCRLSTACWWMNLTSSRSPRPWHAMNISLICRLLSTDLRSSIPLLSLSPALEHLRISLTRGASTRSSCTRTFSRTSSMVVSSQVFAFDCARSFPRHQLFVQIHQTIFRVARAISILCSSHSKLSDAKSTTLRRIPNQPFNKNWSTYTSVCSADSESRNIKIDDRLIVGNTSDTWSPCSTLGLVITLGSPCPSSLIGWNVWPMISLIFTPTKLVGFRPHTSIDHFDFFLCCCPVELETNDHSQACLSPIATSGFQITFQFHDLNEDTRLTLPTVETAAPMWSGTFEDRSCRRLFCLTPHLDHLTLDSEDLLQVIDAVKCQYKPFMPFDNWHFWKVYIVLSPIDNREQHFPNAIVTYRKRSFSN